MHHPLRGALAGFVLLPLLASCSSSGAPAAGGGRSDPTSPSQGGRSQDVTVHTTDQLRFQPSTIHVHVGTVHVKIVDDGSYPHDLDVPSQRARSHTVTGNPGSTVTTTTLRFTSPGAYPFECTYHDTSGMRGRFVVTK